MRIFVLERHPKPSESPVVTEFYPLDPIRGKAPHCPVCGGYIAMMPLLSPVRVDLEIWGTACGDIAYGPGDELLVTERFWVLYQASGLIGLHDVGPAEVAKVRAHRKQEYPVPRYHCCRVGQGAAAIDDTKSGLEREEPKRCQECRQGGIIKRTKRVVLEPNSWAGEDIFFARGLPGIALVSEEFERFCRNNQISNCVLVQAATFSFDHYPWEHGDERNERHL